jgi:putative ABC transport system permease protein
MGLARDSLNREFKGESADPVILRHPRRFNLPSRGKKKNNNKNFKQIFILSFDALKERKARSALTILMVVVGGGLMIAINGMSAGQSAFVTKQLNFLAPNIMFVSSGQHGFRGPSGPPTIIFNSEVVNRIKSLPFVQQVIPQYQAQLQLNAMGNVENAQVMGMDPTKLVMIAPSLQLVPGSSIQANNPTGMLVGDNIANPPGLTTPFVTVGQTVKATYSYADPNTGKLQTASRSFIVTGILAPTGNNQVDKAVVINEATANSLFHKSGKYDSMAVAALSGDYVDTVQKEITNIYGSNNIGVITPKAILQTREKFQSGNSAFILDIAFISLLVGAVGIITTLYTSVNERVKEIGTMKAIGAKNMFILSLFMSEALLIGLIGSTLGIVMGVNLAYILTGFSPGGGGPGGGGGGGGGGGAATHVSPIFIPNDVLNVWILSVILSLAAGIFPAWKASRLSPLEALRR